jgi:hypothetical protein
MSVNTLSIISSLSILIPSLLGGLLFTKLTKPFRRLSFYLAIGIIIQLTATGIRLYFTTVPNKYNLFLYHILILVELAFLTSIYKLAFQDFIHPRFFTFLIIIFSLFSITNTIWVMEPFDSITSFFWNFRYIARFNNYAQLLEDVLLISLAFLYLYKLMRQLKIENLEKDPFFLLSVGVLIYFSSKFTLDILNNFLLEYSRKIRSITWGVHSIINILLHLFYSLAIWQNSRVSSS